MSKPTKGERRTAQLLAFPALNALPAPTLPLKGIAYDAYVKMAQRLLTNHKLNVQTQQMCEQYAVLYAKQYKDIDRNMTPSAASFDRINKILKDLSLVDESDATAQPEGSEQNRFARFGSALPR